MTTSVSGAVLREIGETLSIEQVHLSPITRHEVRVSVRACGICRSDLTVSSTDHGFPLPLMLGHEIAGVVEEVGSDVTHLQVGDHVVACPVNHCGTCDRCKTGQPILCPNGSATRRQPGEPPRATVGEAPLEQFIGIGGFAEQVVMHQNLVVRIPKEIPFDIACLLGCGVSTGLGAVLNAAAVRHGDTVLVVGCGGVGLNAVQGARIAGARRIIALDRSPDALLLAEQLGATDLVDAGDDDPVARVKELTGGLGVTHSLRWSGFRKPSSWR